MWLSGRMHVCMVTYIARVWINRVANPARGQVKRGNEYFLVRGWCLRIWPRETGPAVLSRVSLLISILRLNLVLTYGIPPEFRGGVHLFILNRHTPSGQSRVYRVTHAIAHRWRSHCRESAGTGPVNLNVVPNECCLGRSPCTNTNAPLFPTPTIGMEWAC